MAHGRQSIMCAVLVVGTTATWAQPVEARHAVTPERPTSRDEITVRIELTNDSLDPCHYAVRLYAPYGGLTGFERTEVRLVFGVSL